MNLLAALNRGDISPFTTFDQYKNATDYVAKNAPDMVNQYNDDANAALNDIVNRVVETGKTIEEVVGRVKPEGNIIDSINTFEDNKGNTRFRYKNNPMDNPKAARDIIENPDAVYGYSPKRGGRLDEYVDAIDWTNERQVELARQKRMEYHEKLRHKVDEFFDEGYSVEDIARHLVNSRNTNRINSYLEDNDFEGLERLKKSNIRTYGNQNGPTPEWLYKKYGSWEDIVFSSMRSNPGMDACTGLYDIYYGGI